MELETLYQIADENSIAVHEKRLKYSRSHSMMDGSGECYIAIDPFCFETRAEEKTALGHDIGHCLTGCFYSRYSPFDERRKHEHKANKKAAYTLIPLLELIDVLDSPWNTVYDLSEHFGVTEQFMRKALSIYEYELQCAAVSY